MGPSKIELVLRDIPSEIATPRLLLRVPREWDGPIINEAVRESHQDLKEWMPWACGDEPPTLSESEFFARNAAAQFILRESISLLGFDRGSGRLVLSCGMPRINWEGPTFEIGYWCRSSCLGQGYVTEAVHGLTTFALNVLGAKRLEILCDERNVKSRKVAERGGFTLEGVRHNDSRDVRGELRNTCVYVLCPLSPVA